MVRIALSALVAGGMLLASPATGQAAPKAQPPGQVAKANNRAPVIPTPVPATPVPPPPASPIAASPVPVPAPGPVSHPGPAVVIGFPVAAPNRGVAAFAVPRAAGPAAPVSPPAVPPVVTQEPAPNLHPLVSGPPGIPAEGVLVDGLPAGLVVSLSSLPLLLAIFMLAMVRVMALVTGRPVDRSAVAIAAQLGVSPAALSPLGRSGLRRLMDQVAFDELTGVMRRSAGMAALQRELRRAERTGAALTVVFIDVDGLKAVNDEHGHRAGDELLRAVAQSVATRLRGADLIFRYGGDEFVCGLVGATASEAAEVIGQAARADPTRGSSFSFGVGQFRPGDEVDALVARADAELYRGRAGRSDR